MSDELFMYTYPREGVTVSNLFEQSAKGGETCIRDCYRTPDNPKGLVSVRQAIREHPDAYFQLNVPVAALWQAPIEPRGLEWKKDKAKRRTHREAVRDSLQSFINGVLAKLCGMLRTGEFVLGKARVKVVECKPVPDYVFRRLGRHIRKAGGIREYLSGSQSRKQRAKAPAGSGKTRKGRRESS